MTEQQAPVVDTANANQTQSTAEQPWYSGFQDESLRGYMEVKGFKDPSALADSYRNLEKLRGVPENELLRLPKEGDADAWNQFYSRLGRPEKADGYQLPVPEGDDGAFSKAAAEWMHAAGLSPAQATMLAEKNNEFLASQLQAHQEQIAHLQEQEMTQLKSEWGQAFEQNTEIAKRAARQFGIGEEVMNRLEEGMGTKGLLEFFHNIGSKLGEHKIEGMGNGVGEFKLSPSAAKEQINMLMQDREWASRYLNGGAAEKMQMERLQQAAAFQG